MKKLQESKLKSQESNFKNIDNSELNETTVDDGSQS